MRPPKHILPPHPQTHRFVPQKRRTNIFRFFLNRRQSPRRTMLFTDHYQEHRGNISRLVKVILVLIAIVLIIQSLFRIPLLRITNVQVSGLKYIASTEVKEYVHRELLRRRWIIFKNNSYLLVALDRMKQRLEDEYLLRVLELKKVFPNTLIVVVQERISGFVLQTPTQFIQIDTKGSWIGEVSEPQPGQSIIADERALPGTAIPIEYLEKATTIKEQWDRVIPNLKLVRFHLTDDMFKMEVSTDKGFRVFFSPTKDLKSQVERLAVFLQEAPVHEPQQYIDLRFDERLHSL